MGLRTMPRIHLGIYLQCIEVLDSKHDEARLSTSRLTEAGDFVAANLGRSWFR